MLTVMSQYDTAFYTLTVMLDMVHYMLMMM